MTANNFGEFIRICKTNLAIFQIFTMSKKRPVVLNFRCNLTIAECCLVQLAANSNQYYDTFYNNFNSN